jgi:hypothetical protein
MARGQRRSRAWSFSFLPLYTHDLFDTMSNRERGKLTGLKKR